MNVGARFRTQIMLKELLESGDWFTVDGILESMFTRDWGPGSGPTTQAIPTRKELAHAIRAAPLWLGFIALPKGVNLDMETKKHTYHDFGYPRQVTWYRFVIDDPTKEEE